VKKQLKQLLMANNRKPNLYLRVNTLITTSDEFVELLKKVQLKYSKGKYLA
jgi:16S rRNA C967 or C1407 C5-methylase (RsmB/RsmF family)